MTSFSRADRVSQLIQRELSDILMKETRDPRLKMATITAVKLSKDIKNARIYFCVSGSGRNADDVQKGFQSACGHIKRVLAGRLDLRYMPELRFYYDDSFDYGEHIETLLKSITDSDPANAHGPDQPDYRPVDGE